MRELIEWLNGLFEGERTDDNILVYVTDVLFKKLLESKTLIEQAANNTKEHFANSPDLMPALTDAIIEAHDAHTAMSTQAINSEAVRVDIRDLLLQYAKPYEALKERAA